MLNYMACDKGILTKYICKQLIDMKYLCEMQNSLAFFEIQIMNLDCSRFYKWIAH
jgi:hypothetical protein